MKGNASVYQVYPISLIIGDGRAEFIGAWGSGFEQEEAGGAGQINIYYVRGNYKSLKGTNLAIDCGRNAFIMYIL